MSKPVNIVQITGNLFLSRDSGVIYSNDADIVAMLDPDKDEIHYIDEAPEQLKAELGAYLSRLNSID